MVQWWSDYLELICCQPLELDFYLFLYPEVRSVFNRLTFFGEDFFTFVLSSFSPSLDKAQPICYCFTTHASHSWEKIDFVCQGNNVFLFSVCCSRQHIIRNLKALFISEMFLNFLLSDSEDEWPVILCFILSNFSFTKIWSHLSFKLVVLWLLEGKNEVLDCFEL